MARASSVVRVDVIGDAKGLQSELRTADQGLKGFASSTKAILGGVAVGVAADALIDFGTTALAEADRLGDAGERLEIQLGDAAQELVDGADEFASLGQSAQDVLELEAAIVDIGEALGIAKPDLAAFADDAAATAAAVALMGDQDAATVIDLIGKAAGGSEKALRALGINLTDAEIEARALRDTGKPLAETLTDGELAAAGMALVLEKLKPKLDAATDGARDLEQATGELGAKIETLQGQAGTVIDEALTPLLDGVLDLTDAVADSGVTFDEWAAYMKEALGPLGDVIEGAGQAVDILGKLAGLLGIVNDAPRSSSSGPARDDWAAVPANVTVNVNGGDPAEAEASVSRALRGYYDRNGALMVDL